VPNSILLRRDLHQPLPPLPLPEGITLEPFDRAAAPECHALLRRGYAEGGGSVPASFDDWWRSASTDPEFDPELVFLARAGEGALVGVAVCWSTGFVKDFAVDPDFRRRGLGAALLLAILTELRARGHSQAGLKLQNDNHHIGARRLYERLGFVIG
jgi:ribosomal protein S18 acetylase RimI-like enzyme